MEITEIINEIVDKYSTDFDMETLLNCLDNSIIDSVAFVKGNRPAFVMWDGIIPEIYIVWGNSIVRLTEYSNSLIYLIRKNLIVNLHRQKILRKYMQTYKFTQNIVVGTIKHIDKEEIKVEVDGINNNEVIEAVMTKLDQPITERNTYCEDLKLFFYVKNVLINDSDEQVKIFLSRISKNFAGKLIKYLSADKNKGFYLRNGRMPIITCYKRVAGICSVVLSDIYIPRKIIEDVSYILSGEKIFVRKISLPTKTVF